MTNKIIRKDTKFGIDLIDKSMSREINDNNDENNYLSDENEGEIESEYFEDLEELEFELLEIDDEEESLMDDDSADL